MHFDDHREQFDELGFKADMDIFGHTLSSSTGFIEYDESFLDEAEQVEQGSFRELLIGETLSTGGLGPCTGFVFVSKQYSSVGHLVFNAPKEGEAEDSGLNCSVFDSMLAEIEQHVSSMSEVTVYLAGTNHDTGDAESDERDKQYVQNALLEALSERGIPSEQIKPKFGASEIGIDAESKEVQWRISAHR